MMTAPEHPALYDNPIVMEGPLLRDFQPDGTTSLQETDDAVGSILLPVPNDTTSSQNFSTLFEEVGYTDSFGAAGDINIDSIQLYLECSDDSESVISDGSRPTAGHSANHGNAATSQIKSDLQFKISFPKVPNESMKVCKCCVCKRLFVSQHFLREHILLEHRGLVHICQFCAYVTKSDKLFRTHMNTRHKDQGPGVFDSVVPVSYEHPSYHPSANFNPGNENSVIENSVVNIAPDNSEAGSTNRKLTTTTDSDDINVARETLLNEDPEADKHERAQSESSITYVKEIAYVEAEITDSIIKTTDDSYDVMSDSVDLSGQQLQTRHEANPDQSNVVEGNMNKIKESRDNVTNDMYYACESCDYVTQIPRLLSYHRNNMHNKDRVTYKCSKCSYTCKQKRSFEAHAKKHEKVFDFPCSICGKQFASKHLLTKHSRLHREKAAQAKLCTNTSSRSHSSNVFSENVTIFEDSGKVSGDNVVDNLITMSSNENNTVDLTVGATKLCPESLMIHEQTQTEF